MERIKIKLLTGGEWSWRYVSW